MFKRGILCTALALLLCVAGVGGMRTETVSADAAEAYYASVTQTGGDALLGALHDLITTTHTTYTSYDDVKRYAPQTDPALDGGAGIVEFYTHEPIREYTLNGSDAGRWNREHVWAQALSSLWGKEGGGSDLHHIRPSEVKINAARGNDKFGEVTGGGAVYSKKTDGSDSMVGGHRSGGVFEPLDNVKGDVARIVLYLYTHYNTYKNVHGTTDGAGQESYFGTLRFTNIMAASTEEGAIELLLAWNEADPVDAIETTRNEQAYKVQGNRNPYIDHPEYAAAIWAASLDKAGAFESAVGEILSEGSLGARLASINRALEAYAALSDAEKAAAEAQVALLQAAIAAYNAAAEEYNGRAERAERAALGGAL